MTKQRYHNFEKPVKVLITGRDRRQCLQFFKWADEILAQNAPPFGDRTNLRSYKKDDVYHLVIDNLQDIRFTLDFDPIVFGTSIPDEVKNSDLAIYCSNFEEPRGDTYDLLADETELVLIDFLQRQKPFMIVLAEAGAIFEKADTAIDWPALHLFLMKSLYESEESPPYAMREGGLQLLDSLAALVAYYSKAGKLFQPVEIFNFTDAPNARVSGPDGPEWLVQFMHLLLSLDKNHRYKYLTFSHIYG